MKRNHFPKALKAGAAGLVEDFQRNCYSAQRDLAVLAAFAVAVVAEAVEAVIHQRNCCHY